MGDIQKDRLSVLLDELDCEAIVAFRPTGWAGHITMSEARAGKVKLYSVPYSEHSSFTQLKKFVKHLKPTKIVPTVNVESAKEQVALLCAEEL